MDICKYIDRPVVSSLNPRTKALYVIITQLADC